MKHPNRSIRVSIPIGIMSVFAIAALIWGRKGNAWFALLVYAILSLSGFVLNVCIYEHTHQVHQRNMRNVIEDMGCGIPEDAIPEDAMRQASIMLKEYERMRTWNVKQARTRLFDRLLQNNSHTMRMSGTEAKVHDLQHNILKFDWPCFILINISISDYLTFKESEGASGLTIDEYRRISDRVVQVFEQQFNRDFTGVVSDFERDFVCLINLTGYTEERLAQEKTAVLAKLVQLTRNAQEKLAREDDVPCFCSLSAPFYSIAQTHEAMEYASSLELYALLVNWPDTVIVADELPAPDPDLSRQRGVLKKKYFNALVTHNLATAEDLFIEMIGPTYCSGPEEAVRYRQEIMIWLGTTFDILQQALSSNQDLLQLMHEISTSDSISEIIDRVHMIFYVLNQTNPNQQSEGSGSKIDCICQYLEREYRNPDLSLTMVSSEFHMNPSYLSHLFKQVKGISFLDYIHTLRLQEVKRLLTKTDLSITSISQQTGYYSGWTLTRTFKRYTGISPSEYRNLIEKST